MGRLVRDGRSFEVTSVELRGGVVRVVAWIPAPLDVALEGPITVFGADGVGVWQGATSQPPWGPWVWPAEIVYDLRVTSVVPRDSVVLP